MKDSYIGENIRFYRERLDFTQQNLADKVGVSWEMISRYERSASSPLNKLHKLSKALNIPASQLLERHIPENVNSNFKVPLIVNIPKGNIFDIEYSNFYYNAPEWIFQENIKALALDTTLVINNDSPKGGVYYICSTEDIKRNDKILIREGQDILEKVYTGREKDILAKIIAKETRY
jgi:transcriptional regulator with XRE-family HTH domain